MDYVTELAKIIKGAGSQDSTVFIGELISVNPLIIRANGIELKKENFYTVEGMNNLRIEDLGSLYAVFKLNKREYVVLNKVVKL